MQNAMQNVKGHTVTYTATKSENKHKVEFKSTATRVTKDEIDIQTKSGLVTVPLTEGHLYVGRRSSAKIQTRDVSIKKAPQIQNTKKRSKTTQGAKSKKIMALDLMKLNPNLPRSEYIDLFMSELGMTKAGASTYYYNTNKLLSS